MLALLLIDVETSASIRSCPSFSRDKLYVSFEPLRVIAIDKSRTSFGISLPNWSKSNVILASIIPLLHFVKSRFSMLNLTFSPSAFTVNSPESFVPLALPSPLIDNSVSPSSFAYFKTAVDFWYERCVASNSKTIEITTDAKKISFDYKFLWKGSDDTFELMIDGLITQIFYVKDLKETGRLEFDLTKGLDGVYGSNDGKKQVVIYLPADATIGIKKFEIDG